MQSLLGKYGEVDVEKAIETLEFICDRQHIDIEKINSYSEKGKLYISAIGMPFNDTSSKAEKLAKYLIVPIGCYNKFNSRPLCASFMKDNNNTWTGVYIDTLKGLLNRFVEYSDYTTKDVTALVGNIQEDFNCLGYGYNDIVSNNNNSLLDADIFNIDLSNPIEKEIEQVESTVTPDRIKLERGDKFIQSLYDRILLKEKWNRDNYSYLVNYINCLLRKISIDINSDTVNGYIYNKDKQALCFNSGLIDKYMNDIYILIKDNTLSLLDSKSTLIDLGFNRECISNMPKPIRFWKDKSELIFDGALENFDLDNVNSLNHIIVERRYRLPQAYQDMKTDVVCSKIKMGITNALKMAEHNHYYCVPMYNFKRGNIQYLLPVYMDNSLEDTPEVVAIVGKDKGIYTVKTLIGLDEAYINARMISKPDNNWLTI